LFLYQKKIKYGKNTNKQKIEHGDTNLKKQYFQFFFSRGRI